MKIAMLFLAALLPLMAQARNNNPQDTLVVNKPTKVTVITSDSAQTIYIQGKEGNPKYAYRNSIQLVQLQLRAFRKEAGQASEIPKF